MNRAERSDELRFLTAGAVSIGFHMVWRVGQRAGKVADRIDRWGSRQGGWFR